MITKAIVQSINPPANRCIVRMPLFETASNPNPVEAEALVNIAPGLFNNLEVGDIVFIVFEENEIHKPIIIGKLFRGSEIESKIRGGGGLLDTLKVRSAATLPASTLYIFPEGSQQNYEDFETPKKMADYLKAQLADIRVQLADIRWHIRPENIRVDDGDLDAETT